MLLFWVSLLLFSPLIARPAEQRAHELLEVAGGKFVCRTDLPFWGRYEAAYFAGELGVVQENLRNEVAGNLTKIFECNVGVIAGYHALGKASMARGEHRRAYRQLQLAMIFIFTLRAAVTIPPDQEAYWKTSKVEIVWLIREMKRKSDREDFLRRDTMVKIPSDFRDPRLRVAVASICAYPPDHRLILKDVSPTNKQWYGDHHGYTVAVAMQHPRPGADIQHSKLLFMRDLLMTGRFDWVIWMDCDSLVVNPRRTIDSIIYQYTQISDFKPTNTDDTIDGIYNDNGKLVRVHATNQSPLLRATGPHIGEIFGYMLADDMFNMAFGNRLIIAKVVNQELHWDNGVIWYKVQPGGSLADPAYIVNTPESPPWTSFWHGFRGARRFPRRLPLRTDKRCSGGLDCMNIPLDPSIDLLITEEGWGMSSANWIIKNSQWSIDFLAKAFDVCNSSVPFFGDQDAIIAGVTNAFALSETVREEYVSSHIRTIPQRLINAYDSLNAHYMQCHGYLPEDLLVTFPACKDAESCNPAFVAALRPQDCPQCTHHVRVFGPEREMLKRYRASYGSAY
jgi:hypothetical protein